MKAQFSEHTKGIFLGAILGFVSNVVLSVLLDHYSNRIQYLEYRSQRIEAILSSAKAIGDSIQFNVNDKKIDNMSELDLNIYNLSNSDFSDVPVYIDLYNNLGSPLRIISINAYGFNGAKEQVEQLPVEKSKFKDAGIRLGYNLRVANRNEKFPIFTLKVLVEGTLSPDFNIDIAKNGVSGREYDIENHSFISPTQLFFLPYYIAIIVILIVMIFLLKLRSLTRKMINGDKERNKLLDTAMAIIKQQRSATDGDKAK